MNLKKSLKLTTAAALMTAVGSAQAVSISLVADSPTASVGDTINLTVMMDFSADPTLGGGFDILYDPSLVSYVSNSYLTDAALGSDPSFTRDDNPAVVDPKNRVEFGPDRLVGAAFGNFAGLSGPAKVGTLSFLAMNAGSADFGLGNSTSSNVGSFFSAADFSEQTVDFIGTRVEVSAVPIPAAVWLFGSGLLGLVGMARRKAA